MQRLLAASFAVLACAAQVLASDSTLPGFQLTPHANPGGSAVTCSLPGGAFATFDGLSIDRWAADGSFVLHLATFSSFVYPSFLVPTPDGTALVAGETTPGFPSGDLHLVQLDGSGLSPLATIVYNYDAAFLPNGDLIVSAAQQNFGNGNDLVRVQLAPTVVTTIGHLDGPSGPIAVARNGDLYYATQGSGFPPPPGSTDVIRWPYSTVLSGAFLDASNAVTFSTGFDNAIAMAFDTKKGRLYLAENVFMTSYRVLRVRNTAAASIPLVVADEWITGLRFQELGGTASFDAYQPEDGLSLVYGTSDFATFNDLVTCAPKRPVMSASGPGTTGVGSVTLSVSGAVPNGSALMTYCPQTSLLPSEITYTMPKFLLHSTFVLSQTTRFNFLIPTDSNGDGSLLLWNDGGLNGLFGYQFHVGQPNGTLIGASNVVQF